MSDIGYRVTEAGEAQAYRVTTDGYYRVVELGTEPPAPVPDNLIDILRLRRFIYDPPVKDILFFNQLPGAAPAGIACTTGDGNYYVYKEGAWESVPVTFTDVVIDDTIFFTKSIYQAAILLIDRLLLRINPAEWITQANAGGQTMAFASLADITAFYKTLKDNLKDMSAQEAGLSTGRFFQFQRPAVGGVYE